MNYLFQKIITLRVRKFFRARSTLTLVALFGTLTIETKEADGSWKALHVVQGDSLCDAVSGICVNNRNPFLTIVESAAKWVGSGGLNDPLQSVNP